MTELAQLTIHELHDHLKNKKCSAVEAAKSVLARIKKYDGKIGSFITVCEEQALAQAGSVDAAIAKGAAVKPLTGIPIAPKDIYLTEGVQTTAGSRILKGYVPPYDSTVIAKCLNESAVIVGKTNMDEFAMGSSNESSHYGNVRNPWDLERIPGGSSGGSAAAIAADLCVASLGTDTGGSIRQPAAHCGIVGLKPTYGRVSRYGTIAFASSLDQMGPMTKDVTDCALLMNVIAGHDPKDSTSILKDVPDYTKSLNRDVKGLKVGVPREYFVSGLAPDVEKSVKAALKQLESLGAELIEVGLPSTKHCVATYYIIAPAEASSNLARYDGVRYGLREDADTLIDLYKKTKGAGFGAEVKRRIMIGTYVLSAGYYDDYYVRAQKVRTLIRNDFLDAFQKVDVIAGPVTPTTAFKLGEKAADPMQMYLSDIFTISTNLAGLPGMSVPCGFGDGGLPVGLQFTGKAFDEETLIRVAHAYERATEWHKKKPAL
jgi:aspartyl-tRNA(Asn)/glutamyl-tRNA(Gln) amidotransferase subunit A